MKLKTARLSLCFLLATSAYGAVIKGKVTTPQPAKKSSFSGGYSRGVFSPGSNREATAGEPSAGAPSRIVVWAEPVGVSAAFVKPPKKPEMIQEGKAFKPEILVVQTGTTVGFPNLDPLYHNVFSYSRAKRFDLGRYQPGKSKDVTFDEAGVVEVFCEIHENMHAYIIVADTPYFTQADKNGDYRLEVPSGKYRVMAWYPNTKSEAIPVDLTASPETGADFSF